ncbi:hypothetical protein L1987_20218 [Smallanthus sonchifolius]|uniref:Uncharacterized protein n=1 Tax=Smallanthus sonchifolius TaxID=185202 RepID=A0ACB9IU54_9ASTR|nr:hypothetical protein L1987_20218 [Smallanthus sonchifolius]
MVRRRWRRSVWGGDGDEVVWGWGGDEVVWGWGDDNDDGGGSVEEVVARVTDGPEVPNVSIWAADTGIKQISRVSHLSVALVVVIWVQMISELSLLVIIKITVFYVFGILIMMCSGSLNEHITCSKFWCPSTIGDGDESDS